MNDSSSNQDKCNILILYDDFQMSRNETSNKINNIFSIIEKQNEKNKTKLYHNTENDNSYIKLENKYYKIKINYELYPISEIKSKNCVIYEGCILYFNCLSIKNNTFKTVIENLNKPEIKLNSSIILFDVSRDELSSLKEYEKFIEESLDKNFEIICDCSNIEYNEDDGPGALSSSLHGTMWTHSEKIDNKNININDNKKDYLNNLKEDLKKDRKENKKEGYDLLKDEEEADRLFQKIKEIKMINSDPNISDEQRRENAEKAIMMMVNMFGLDEDDELPDNEDDTN